MPDRIHALVQQLTGKSSIEECNVEEVQQMAQRYPYFSPAQFLLLQKLRQSGADDAEAQSRKAVLYYPDPLQFEFFIASENFYKQESPSTSDPVEEVAEAESDEVIPEHTIDSIRQTLLEEVDDTHNEEYLTEEVKDVDIISPVEVPSPEQVEINEIEAVVATGPVHTEPSDFTSLPELSENNEVEKENGVSGNQIDSVLSQSNVSLKADAPVQNSFTFEPYHTVDYFASQGIKVTAEDLVKDKLGKQVKSFTEWLKTMKRLPATIVAPVESVAEKKVESMADSSVSASEVVTEAMAEVWAKQGNHEKAAETYHKLSLLNPSKRAFFAAKIENLKTS